MAREVDSTMAAALPNGVIQPAVLAMITLNSGVEYLWSGVGDLSWNGQTWKGLGSLASMDAITENVLVQAEGTSVTLSGIGLSDIDIPGLGVTPPTLTPPAGQSVAWSLPGEAAVSESFNVSYVLPAPGVTIIGTASGSTAGCSLSLSGGYPFPPNQVGVLWAGFKMPPEIPPGAVITGIYPVAVVNSVSPSGDTSLYVPGTAISLVPPVTGTNILSSIGTSLADASIAVEILNTVEGSTPTGTINISFVGFAVYYIGSPLTKMRLIYEALSDIRVGAPAKLWFGLMENGAFLGNPYMEFAGTVDKPTVNTGPDSSSITLALENRLVNLNRPNNTKYTTADQHLKYPDDMFFQWVEILQEISLAEGQ